MPPVTASPESTPRTRRRFRRPLAAGLLASVLLHLAAALAWRSPALDAGAGRLAPASVERKAVPEPERALRGVALAGPDREEIPSRPRRVPVPAPPRVEAPAAGSEPPGSALEPPAGASASGGSRDGTGRTVVRPPVPRSVLPEWDAPGAVRGRSVAVRVHVDSTGRPTGAVELVPRTPSEAFNRRLVRKVRRMQFSPARDARGRPVTAWAELSFTF